ncbi:hypothetical protein C8Q70DRAFT_935419 [Cubamyces menziesii]|nr:hypothetical protein C8Q70DRAFT_935419 [Cubamyces menziesii]
MANSAVQRHLLSSDNSSGSESMATPSVYPRPTRQAAMAHRSRGLHIRPSYRFDSSSSSPSSDSSSSSVYIPTPRKMPRTNTKSKHSISSGTRRTTRSMTKHPEPVEPVLVDVVNTVDSKPTKDVPMTPPPAEKPQEVLPEAESVRDEETTTAPDSSTPCICTSFKVGHVSNFAKGDRVQVYMRTHGEWSWRAGKVANTSHFRPRLTNTGSRTYPVLLEQRLPRIIQWFDPGLRRIRHSDPGSCCGMETPAQ